MANIADTYFHTSNGPRNGLGLDGKQRKNRNLPKIRRAQAEEFTCSSPLVLTFKKKLVNTGYTYNPPWSQNPTRWPVTARLNGVHFWDIGNLSNTGAAGSTLAPATAYGLTFVGLIYLADKRSMIVSSFLSMLWIACVFSWIACVFFWIAFLFSWIACLLSLCR